VEAIGSMEPGGLAGLTAMTMELEKKGKGKEKESERGKDLK